MRDKETDGSVGSRGRGRNGRRRTRGDELRDDESICLVPISKKIAKHFDKNTYPCYGLDKARNCEHPLVYARNDFADASLDTGLVSQVGDVFTSLSNDDTCVLGAYKGRAGSGCRDWGVKQSVIGAVKL